MKWIDKLKGQMYATVADDSAHYRDGVKIYQMFQKQHGRKTHEERVAIAKNDPAMKEAISHYETALKSSLEHENYAGAATINVEMYKMYNWLGEYDTGIEKLHNAAQMYVKARQTGKLNTSQEEYSRYLYNYLAEAYLRKNDLMKAEDAAKTALSVHKNVNDKNGVKVSEWILDMIKSGDVSEFLKR